MAIALEYKPLIAWRTFAMNVRLLEKETDETPAEYRLRVSPVDRHDLGAGTVDNECYFISFMGNPYTVINTGENFVDVRDDFRVGTAPTAAKIGIVYKSIDKAPFIAPTFYRYLHKTALDNIRKIELSILWQYSQLLNCKWNPKGLLFSFDAGTNNLSHTAGEINVSNWYPQKPEKRVDLDIVTIDPTPVNKSFSVEATVYPIADPDAYYIYALIPLDELANNCILRVTKEYWREKMFNGYITVLVGILNSEANDRELVLNWSVNKQISKIESPLVAEYQDFIAGTAKDYILLLSAIYPFTIDSFWAEVDDGTIDVSLKIGSTTITGINGVTADTTASQIDATDLNSVAIGDRVIFSISATYTGTPTLIRIQIKTTRV